MRYLVSVLFLLTREKKHTVVPNEFDYETDSLPDLVAIRALFDKEITMAFMIWQVDPDKIFVVDELHDLW